MSKGRVLLVGAEDEENLAIRYLGAVLAKNGYTVKISPCSRKNQLKQVLKDVKVFKPNLVGVSIAFQSLANMFFELIKEIKKANPNVFVVVGGHFPTFEYKQILETQSRIDFVIRFEGEAPLSMLMNSVMNRQDYSSVPNLAYRSNGRLMENDCVTKFMVLDKLPFPLRSKKPQMRLGERFATLVASRGCFHSSCLYCCIGAFHSRKQGSKYALRSPENIAKEIALLYHEQKIRLFQFHDDNFMLPSKEDTLRRFRELKKALEGQGVDLHQIAFLIKARPDSINNKIARALSELGVVGVFLGIENASASGLKSLIRGSSLKDINNALRVLSKHNIIVTFNLLIFHPNATLDEINENIYFIKKNSGYPLDFGRAEIVAGSPLERLVINEKLRRGNWPNWDYKIKDEHVEKLFSINLATFRKKGSHYSKLVHSLIALAYRAYAVHRIYPGQASDRTVSEANALIRKANGFILEYVLKMYELAGNIKSYDEVELLYQSIRNGCIALSKEVDQLVNKISRLQALEKRFKELKISKPCQNHKLMLRMFRL
jgi:radical SAM superfamily enzyme YgiQ (UPF0313 family)